MTAAWQPGFEVAADLAGASTPPGAFYASAEAFVATRDRVFASGWQWLCSLHDTPAAGHAAPLTLLPGLLDEPLLLARDATGTLRVLSNVCTHRGQLLLQAPQRCESSSPGPIRCPYHGRRFGLDGRCHFRPGFDDALQPPQASDNLPAAEHLEWAGQVFVRLPSAGGMVHGDGRFEASLQAIEQRLQGLYGPQDHARSLRLSHLLPDPSCSRDFRFGAHWALYVDNYLEGLHIPFVHPGLTQALDWQQYRYEALPAGTWQIALAAEGQAAFTPPPGSPEAGQRIAAYYAWLFPNLMLNFYPWGLSLNVVLPQGPTRTRVLYRGFVTHPGQLGVAPSGAGSALDTVEAEDQAMVLGVQQGLRARLAQRGHYAAWHEQGTHAFHRMWLAALGG